jgi:nucleotide-binding universal stress UspA family protein
MPADSESHDSAPRVDGSSIVVGHDGSPGADHALVEALALARALSAPIVVVRAWTIATAPRPAGWEFGYVASFEEYAEAVRLALMDDARSSVQAFPDVPVEYRAVHGGAAKSLVEISQGARMLVVGARGLGGLAGMLLGSVGDQCVRHAACPVLVTRTRGRPQPLPRPGSPQHKMHLDRLL